MNPSGKILDGNLSGLLRRSWRPVRPSPEFVRRLERELAPWLAGEAIPPRRERPVRRPLKILVPAFAAAAALLLGFLFFLEGAGPGRGSSSRSLDELLAEGAACGRFARGGEWRELKTSEVLFEGDYAELTTPAGRGIRLAGTERWAIELGAGARLTAERAGEALLFGFLSGTARVSGGGQAFVVEAPARRRWKGGAFHDPDAARPGALVGTAAGAGREAVDLARAVEKESAPAEVENPPPPELAVLSGTVREGDAVRAVTEFEVTLLKAAAPPQVALPITRTFREPGGTFRWEELEPGRYSMFVQAAGRAAQKRAGLDLASGEERSVEVTLDEGGTLRGFVVDGESGAAIEGALVVSEGDLPMQVISMTAEEFSPAARAFNFSAADGSFELPRLSAGRHRLRAGAAGFGCSWVDSPPVVVGEVADGVLFELGPGGAVVGHVERPDGTPWSGARVVVSRYSGTGDMSTMSYRSAATDEAGDYAARDLTPGMYVVLFFGEGGLDESEFEPEFVPVRVRASGEARIDFPQRAHGASLTGVVRDGAGKGVPRANVYLFTEGSRPTWVAETAAEDGGYSIEGIEAGRYRLYAGIGQSTVLVAALRLAEGQRATRDVVLDGASLEVRVEDAATGAPLPGVSLLLLESTAGEPPSLPDLSSLVAKTWLGTDGVYRADDLPDGQYVVVATTEGGSHADTVLEDVRVVAGGEVQRLAMQLERAGQAILRVGSVAGDPIEGASVRLRHPHGWRWPFLTRERTGADGSALEVHLEPGTWTAIVTKPGHLGRVIPFEVIPDRCVEVSVVLHEE